MAPESTTFIPNPQLERATNPATWQKILYFREDDDFKDKLRLLAELFSRIGRQTLTQDEYKALLDQFAEDFPKMLEDNIFEWIEDMVPKKNLRGDGSAPRIVGPLELRILLTITRANDEASPGRVAYNAFMNELSRHNTDDWLYVTRGLYIPRDSELDKSLLEAMRRGVREGFTGIGFPLSRADSSDEKNPK